MIYLQLLWSFFQIGLFSFGGGYASIQLIQSQVVDTHHWLTLQEVADVVTISQMTPGPIAINSATFVGLRIAGMGGAVIATIGCVLPSCIIVLLLARLYTKYREMKLMQGVLQGLHPAVVALVASAALSMLVISLWKGNSVSFSVASVDWIAALIFLVVLLILRKWKCNPIFLMLGAGGLGILLFGVLPL